MNTSVNNTRENMNRVNNTAAKIEDFGQKIGGARKDYYAEWREFSERLAGVSVDALKKSALSKLVNLPDLARLFASGAITADAARAIWTLWRSVDHRPGLGYRLNRWAEETAAKVAQIAAIMAGEEVPAKLREKTDYQVMTAANWPAQPFSFGRFSVERPDWFSSEWRVVAGSRYYSRCAKLEEVPAAIAEAIAKDSEERAKGPALAVYVTRAGQYFVAVKGKPEICLKKFDDRAAAYTAAREDRAALIERYNNLRTVPALRRDWNRPRLGEDWRKGENMTPEAFAAALPFRGVEFGNWVNQTERAALLNSAFDGFHDLAAVWGMKPEEMTLCGSLAFAFASRGIPGAMAHYESGHEVINLTKKSGAGCMAHEWFHAADWFAGNGHAQTEHPTDSDAGRAASALVAAIKKTDFYRRSQELVTYSPKGSYWVENCELAARGFEGVMLVLLDAAGICSDFLVNVNSWDAFTAADVEHRSSIYPYPSAAEAAELLPYYLDFFRAVFGAHVQVCAAALMAAEQATEKANQERAITAAKREREAAEKKAAEEAERQAREQEQQRQEAEREAKAAEIAAVLSDIPGVTAARRMACNGGALAVCALWDAQIITVFATAAEAKTMTAQEIAARVSVLQYKRKPARTKNPMIHARAHSVEFCKWDAAEFLEWIANGAGLSRFAWEFAELAAKYGRQPADFRAEAEKMAADLESLKAAQAQKWAQESEQATEQTNTKAEPRKASRSDENAAPAECLQLVEIANGVAVIPADGYGYRATLFNRRQIKAHGCRWNKDSQQWEATAAADVANVRAWFAQSAPAADEQQEQTQEPAAAAPVAETTEAAPVIESAKNQAPTLPDWLHVGAMVETMPRTMLDSRCRPVEVPAEVLKVTAITDEWVEMQNEKSRESVRIENAVMSLRPYYSESEKLELLESTLAADEQQDQLQEQQPEPSQEKPARVCLYDIATNQRTPEWRTSFADMQTAQEWLQRAMNGTGALAADAVDIIDVNPYWGVYYSHRNKEYICLFLVAENEKPEYRAEELRHRLTEGRERHICARLEKAITEATESGHAYIIEVDGDCSRLVIEPDPRHPNALRWTWYEGAEVDERHTEQTAAQCASIAYTFREGHALELGLQTTTPKAVNFADYSDLPVVPLQKVAAAG